MTSLFKGAVMRAMQSAAQGRGAPKGPIGRAVQGALSRVQRPAPPPKGPPPSIAKGTAFRSRNAGPIKPSVTAEADTALAQTGEGLRRTIGRISRPVMGVKKGGKVKKFKEGGKVSSAMSALQKLAADYRAALDMDDTEKATRIKRQMERLKRGSTKEADAESEAVGKEKAATFAKGGKVRGLSALAKKAKERAKDKRFGDILARDFRKTTKMKDTDPVHVRFNAADESITVRARGKKYRVQAGSDDDRFDFRSDDGEHVPVEFSKEWLEEGVDE